MKCNNCGAELGEKDAFCANCGTAVPKEEDNNTGNQHEDIFTYERNTTYIPQQQPRPTEQNIEQSNNNEQSYQKNKNIDDIVKICVGTVIGLAILAVIVFIIYLIISALSNNNKKIENNASSSSAVSGNNTVTATSDTKTPTPTVATTTSTSTYQVNYEGFKLSIPDNLVYEIDYENNELRIGDAELTWITEFLIEQSSFQELKNNKNQISTYLTEQYSEYGGRVANATVETIGGVEFILLEAEIAGDNVLMGYASLNSMYSACFSIQNEDNDFNREQLKELATIIRTAEYTGDFQYLKVNEKIKLTDLDIVIDKIMEATDEK